MWLPHYGTPCIEHSLLFSPLLLVNPSLYWQIEGYFFNWLLSMVACWNYTAGYNVFESGDRLEDIVDDTFLFMPNHQVRCV